MSSFNSVLLLLSAVALCANALVSIQLTETGSNFVVPLSLSNNARTISLVPGVSYQISCVSNVGFAGQLAWTNATSGSVVPGSGSTIYQTYDSGVTTWFLLLTPFSTTLSGKYNCSDSSSIAAITIGQGNPVAIASQPYIAARLGVVSTSGIMLSCFTSGLPKPSYLVWYYQNQVLLNTSTSSLYLVASGNMPIQASMAGTYSCSVVTSAGIATADTVVDVIIPVLLSRSFFAAPVAYEGGNLTLTCVASQGSSISFTWAFGSAPLSNGGRVSIVALNSSASQLTVTQLSYTDAGTYQCTASLSAIVQSDTFSMPIVIQYAPILQPLFSYNVTGIENSSAVLDLKIMSVPSVVGVVWSKGGNVISSDGSKYTTSFFNSSLSNASLTLLGLKDTDIGSYTCTVSNSFKTTSVSFNLAVMIAPVLVPSPSGSQVVGVIGYPLVIAVQLLRANPPVSPGGIYLVGGGIPLSLGGRITLIYSSTLVTLNISSVGQGDAMNYTLVVPHPAGTRNHSFQLLVKGPPLPPTGLSISAVSECTFTLVWATPVINTSSVPAQAVIFQVRANGSGIQWADVGVAVSVQDTSVVLGQPYVGGAGIVSGQMYQFRGISLYQLIRGSPSVESTFMTANSQGTRPTVGTVTADPGTSTFLVLRWVLTQHSCYVIAGYLLACGPTSTAVSNQTATSGEVVGLTPNTQYNCSVTLLYVDSVGTNFSSSVTISTFTYPSIPLNTVTTSPVVTEVKQASVKVTITPPSGFVSSHCWVVVIPGSSPVGSPDQLYPAGYSFGQYQTSSPKSRAASLPYITAEIPLTGQEGLVFTVGDNSSVEGYLNGPLPEGKSAIFVRYFASSLFVPRQYSVFMSTNFITVELASTPSTLGPSGAMTPPAGGAVIGGAVGGAVGGVIAVVLIILVVVVVVVHCRNRGSKALADDTGQGGHVEASFRQGTSVSYRETENDKSMLCASPPPPPQYSIVPPQSSRPIPVNQMQQKEKEMEKEGRELLSDDIPDGPPASGVSPLPTYRNLLEAEQMVPANMKTSEEVPVAEFAQYVATRDAKKGLLFEKEFRSIQENSPRYPAVASQYPLNDEKNRYSNIVAFDHTRVKLSSLQGVECSDYINANFIKGYHGRTNYIAAQGPLDQTVGDFWRMIWEHNVPTVVMLTNIMEEGKAKCSQYWPSSGMEQEYGGLLVKVEHTILLPDHTIRSLTVTSPAGTPRSVLHFHYTNWHDYGTPTHLAPLINFIRVVGQSHVEQGPLLVHCSAGVGRTGTVIAIDYCLRQIEEEGVVDVKGVVSLLREQRNFMVQTEQQFMCIHYVLLEAILCGNTSYTISEFSKDYVNLQLINGETGVSLVEEEFQKLNSVKTMISKSSFINKVKPNAGSLLHEYPAYFVKGYLSTQQFIVADGPGHDSIEHFWQMVIDSGCSNIVMLTPGDVETDPYWPRIGHKFCLNDISVEVLDERPEHMYNVRKIVLTNRTGGTHQVMQYQFIGWITSKLPDVPSFVQFVCEISRLIDENSYTNNAILVHDTTSLGPSGVFCALWYCIERLRLEKVVDVFQAVQKLQLQKPGMVETVKQYAFIYDCVHEFITVNTTSTDV